MCTKEKKNVLLTRFVTFDYITLYQYFFHHNIPSEIMLIGLKMDSTDLNQFKGRKVGFV